MLSLLGFDVRIMLAFQEMIERGFFVVVVLFCLLVCFPYLVPVAVRTIQESVGTRFLTECSSSTVVLVCSFGFLISS